MTEGRNPIPQPSSHGRDRTPRPLRAPAGMTAAEDVRVRVAEIRARLVEIRAENPRGDASYRDIEWLCRVAESAAAVADLYGVARLGEAGPLISTLRTTLGG